MAKMRGPVTHTTVSTKGSITTVPSIYYGCTIVNKSTGGVQVAIFDAVATAQETNRLDVVTVVAGTNNNNGTYYPNGIVAHSGIYLSAIVCTTAADSVIIFYGGI